MSYIIRPTAIHDIPALKLILDSIELFPSEMLEEMSHGFFNSPESQDIWLSYLEEDEPIAFAYCAPEQLTEGTFNLYAIGVRPDIQSRGIGSKLMEFLENYLYEKNHRILIVETSGTDLYDKTRRFYERIGYTKEVVIRDFWSDGDDKVIYWKRLR